MKKNDTFSWWLLLLLETEHIWSIVWHFDQ